MQEILERTCAAFPDQAVPHPNPLSTVNPVEGAEPLVPHLAEPGHQGPCWAVYVVTRVEVVPCWLPVLMQRQEAITGRQD